MKALLLSAGYGTRLKPLTETIPKCLVPIHGRALLDFWIEMLYRAGIHPVLINLHYLPEQVTAHIAKSPYRSHIKTVWEKRLLGTAGTLLKNKVFFNHAPVFMAHADNLSVFDIHQFVTAHASRPACCDITMMTFDTDTPQRCGIVELDKRGVVTAFHEKQANPPGNLANGAVYIIEPTIFNFLDSFGKEEIDFSTDVLPHYLGRIYTFHNRIYHRDIGTPESYRQANLDFIDPPVLI